MLTWFDRSAKTCNALISNDLYACALSLCKKAGYAFNQLLRQESLVEFIVRYGADKTLLHALEHW